MKSTLLFSWMVMNKPEEVKHQISPHNTDMENVDDDTDTDTDNPCKGVGAF